MTAAVVLDTLRRWLEDAPAGTLLPAQAVAQRIEELAGTVEPEPPTETVPQIVEPESWKVRLWLVPAETRLNSAEVCEATGRSPDWLYRHTSRKCDHRIPHRKMDGELVFVAGELREWLRDSEERVKVGATDAPAKHLRLASS